MLNFQVFSIHGYPYCLAINPRNRMITAGYTDGSIVTFHSSSRNPIHQMLGHGACITSISYSSQGDELLTGSHDGTVRQWMPSQSLLCIRTIIPANYTPV